MQKLGIRITALNLYLHTGIWVKKMKKNMSEILLLIFLAAVVIFGGYLLGYRSGKHKALRENREDENSSKE